MKTVKYTFIIAAAIITLSGCADMLELAPTDKIASANMWTSPELAQKGINGIYESFYNHTDLSRTQIRYESLDGMNKYGIEGLGFCTDYYSNNYPLYLLSLENKKANDVQINHEWKTDYNTVHAANDAIANLKKAGLDEATYQRFLSEAYFLRAWTYSRLNQFFWGVPIYTEPVSNDQCIKTQDKAYDVWKLVIDDLTFCIGNEYCPNETITQYLGRPSKGAAYALRGNAYMWMAAKDENGKQRADSDPKAAEYYALAEKDFAKVAEMGYSLFNGRYIDFFKAENEHNPEMIFAIQYDEAAGYRDNIQLAIGARDTYNGWTEVKPAADFVDYYQNSDGSKFEWNKVPGLEKWDELTDKQRAVYFCRDSLKSNEKYAQQKNQAVSMVGEDVFNELYLDLGNEERIRKAYDTRDPRLAQTIVTPYESIDCFAADGRNNNSNMIGKKLRWPLFDQGTNGGDFWLDKRTSAFYCYKKYCCFLKDEIVDRLMCHADFPLIRYTDVVLKRAEALIELNRMAEAKDLIDQIRSRAGMPGISLGDIKAMRDAVRYERRVEFPVEAINYFDECRWGTYKESKFQGKDIHGGQAWWGDNTVEYPWYYQDCLWPWAAPAYEYQRNPAIVQAPGWIY